SGKFNGWTGLNDVCSLITSYSPRWRGRCRRHGENGHISRSVRRYRDFTYHHEYYGGDDRLLYFERICGLWSRSIQYLLARQFYSENTIEFIKRFKSYEF